MKIGLFGGTFNPPHNGHWNIACMAKEELGLDRLILMPAGIPPHKVMPQNTADTEERFRMTCLLASTLQEEGISTEVSRLELERAGKSYTSDTLRELKKSCPADEIFLNMGGDMFLTLDQWHESDVIFSLAHIAAAPREGDEMGKMQEKKKLYEGKYSADVTILEGRVLELSSTDIRMSVETGEAYLLLPPKVAAFVSENKLYQSHTRKTFEEIKTQLTSELSAYRMNHVLGVVRESERLAAFHRIDPEKAKMAALLHDCTKEWDDKKQLQLIEKCGIMVEKELLEAPQLLHTLSGSIRAKTEFMMDEDIVSAIRWHATGRAAMTPLEMLIYVADLVEPTRHFADEVSDIRSAAEESLEKACRMEAERIISLEKAKGHYVHSQTVKTRGYYKNLLNRR